MELQTDWIPVDVLSSYTDISTMQIISCMQQPYNLIGPSMNYLYNHILCFSVHELNSYSLGTYRTECIPPLKTPRPPSYSFGSRTLYVKTASNPAPNAYSLPNMLGADVIGKKSAATFKMTGRSLIGSFNEDLSKVRFSACFSLGNRWSNITIITTCTGESIVDIVNDAISSNDATNCTLLSKLQTHEKNTF